jgi:hypothetical protein
VFDTGGNAQMPMMARTKRLLFTSVVLVLLAAAVAALLLVRRHAAPEAARLLPECDGVVYLNLRNVHRLTTFSKAPAAKHDPEYDEFIRETGFDFERDLDEAAIAIHLGSPVNGRTGENRYSQVLRGHFDHPRVQAYLRKISKSVESYEGVDIFNVPVEDRTVRVAILNIDTVAVSNVHDPNVIQGIIDRSRHLALPVRGSSLLTRYYRDVPLASLVWAIARIPAAPADARASSPFPLPGGFDVLMPYDSTVIASVRYVGSLRARIDFLLSGEEQARQFATQAGTFLEMFKSVESSLHAGGSDPDVKAVFDSLKIQQEKEHATLSASIPTGFLRKFFSEPMFALDQPKEPSESRAPVTRHRHNSKAKNR